MKLGDVLRKERVRKGLSEDQVARKLGLEPELWRELESGDSAAESWGPILATLAIELETPTSRLLAESGRAEDCAPGQAGTLIAQHRERRGKTLDELGEATGLSSEELASLERGQSPLEEVGPRLLAFAEIIEQPIFNLFYPCGLPFQELDDYP